MIDSKTGSQGGINATLISKARELFSKFHVLRSTTEKKTFDKNDCHYLFLLKFKQQSLGAAIMLTS